MISRRAAALRWGLRIERTKHNGFAVSNAATISGSHARRGRTPRCGSEHSAEGAFLLVSTDPSLRKAKRTVSLLDGSAAIPRSPACWPCSAT